jgi:pimeloyl-ACP methyl ester carboxylesterase
MADMETSDTVLRPLVLLVHGAWHGAWCWAALQSELDQHGIASLAIDLPGHGASTLPLSDMHGDAQHVADIALKIGRPVVLVGHSYGGGVIGEAAHILRNSTTAPVQHLLYLTAFCLDAGESVGGLAASLPPEEALLNAAILPGPNGASGGTLVLDCAKAHGALYGCCPANVSDAAIARLSPQPVATLGQPASSAPWKTLPSTYVVCEQDQAVHPNHQRTMAERCGTVHSLNTDHSPFVSMTVETAAIIKNIVLA